jgi:nicotinamide mononucleotide transporter
VWLKVRANPVRFAFLIYVYKKNLSITEIWQQFLADIHKTPWYEYVAVFSGIASVWFSRIENILLYPVGLASTIIYVYLSIQGSLVGEASVNFYYTVMSIYGWIIWAKRNEQHQHVVHITSSNKRWWTYQLLFFIGCYVALFIALTSLKKNFYPNAIPWADAFASATAFTGMWLMARKKVESWWWWIATDIASVPLYFVEHYVFTSVYYLVLFVLAVFGLIEWMRRAKKAATNPLPLSV